MTKVTPLLLMAAVLWKQQRPFLPAPDTHPLICAHRGRLIATEPENSVAVMRNTFRRGIAAVEIDLAESASGQIYLLHDRSLDRTTTATGLIHDHTDAQLARVFLRDPASEYPSQLISRFTDLLHLADKSYARILVDLKDTPPSDAILPIRKRGMLGDVILLTFDRKTADLAFASDPSVLVSVLVHSKAEIDSELAHANGHPLALYVSQEADSSAFVYAKQTGHIVITDALGSLDERAASPVAPRLDDKTDRHGPSVYNEFLRKHPVDILVTNHPLLAQNALLHP